MADIFLSYSRKEKAKAVKFLKFLEGNGWDIWWDNKILPGKRWDKVIDTQLENAKCVIVLWTKKAYASDHVFDEITSGHERGILLPVMFENIKVPFKRLQTCDFTSWPKFPDQETVDILLTAVKEMIREVQSEPYTWLYLRLDTKPPQALKNFQEQLFP